MANCFVNLFGICMYLMSVEHSAYVVYAPSIGTKEIYFSHILSLKRTTHFLNIKCFNKKKKKERKTNTYIQTYVSKCILMNRFC